jgi:hypothetical protein
MLMQQQQVKMRAVAASQGRQSYPSSSSKCQPGGPSSSNSSRLQGVPMSAAAARAATAVVHLARAAAVPQALQQCKLLLLLPLLSQQLQMWLVPAQGRRSCLLCQALIWYHQRCQGCSALI